MSEKDCSNCPEVHKLDKRVSILEERTSTMKEDIQELKDGINKIVARLDSNGQKNNGLLVGIIVSIGLTVFGLVVGG